MASELCDTATYRVRGQDGEAADYPVATPGMIRRIPRRRALILRGDCAPVITHLPMVWNDWRYRWARLQGRAVADLTVSGGHAQDRPGHRTDGARQHPGSRACRIRQRHRVRQRPRPQQRPRRACGPVPVGPAVSPDPAPQSPLDAVLQQLAELRDQVTLMEAAHQRDRERIDKLAEAAARKKAKEAKEAEAYEPAPAPRWWQLDAAGQRAAIARLSSWVDTVFRRGYGHLAAKVGPCWYEHPLCLYYLDWLSETWTVIHQPATRDAGMLWTSADWHTRFLPAAVALLEAETAACDHLPAHVPAGWRRPVGRHAVSAPQSPQDAALAYAAAGWPVFPVTSDGHKAPVFRSAHRGEPPRAEPCRGECGRTGHGLYDATTDEGQIREWWGGHPERAVAIATGAPGPDVLDVDVKPEGSGFAALTNSNGRAWRMAIRRSCARPSAAFHLYYAGTGQANGQLPRQFLDFRSKGGYVVALQPEVQELPRQLPVVAARCPRSTGAARGSGVRTIAFCRPAGRPV